MKATCSSVTAIFVLCGAHSASAEVFRLTTDFDTFDPFGGGPSVSATGMIATTGNNGLFTLQSGVSSFSASGFASWDAFLGGPFALNMSDVSFLQLTLLDGVVQDFHLGTKDFDVPAQTFGQGPIEASHASFSIDGISDDGYYYTSMKIFSESGSDSSVFGFSTITAVPEPSTWMLTIAGLSLSGTLLRRRHTVIPLLVTG